jgi:ribonuclease E
MAMPEMAMGKVIVMRKPEPVETPKAVSEVVETAVVEAVTTEAPVVAEPVIAEAVVAEAPKVIDAAPESTPAPVAEAKVSVEPATEAVAPSVEASIEAAEPKDTAPENATFKGHASAPMSKAEGKQELGEIIINAAPAKAERYQPKGAGSQVATNSASAAMTKPNY